MSFSDVLHDGLLATGSAGVLYSATVAMAAITAIAARTPARRRAALDVLQTLLRRPPRSNR